MREWQENDSRKIILLHDSFSFSEVTIFIIYFDQYVLDKLIKISFGKFCATKCNSYI